MQVNHGKTAVMSALYESCEKLHTRVEMDIQRWSVPYNDDDKVK